MRNVVYSIANTRLVSVCSSALGEITMSYAWDPGTGLSIGTDDLNALVAAAGASSASSATVSMNEPPLTPPSPSIPPAAGGVGGAPYASVRLFSPLGKLIDHFVSPDAQTATDRVVTLLPLVNEVGSRVVIECGAISAIICRSERKVWHADKNDANKSGWIETYQTCWMMRDHPGAQPLPVSYNLHQLPVFLLQMAKVFFSMAERMHEARQLTLRWNEQQTTKARQKTAPPSVPPFSTVPPTPLETDLLQGTYSHCCA